jgi:hypothetical protein
MSDRVIENGVKLRDSLEQCAKEFRIHSQMARTDSGKTLCEYDAQICEYDAQICEASARMLEKLGTEVTRLRLCIQHWRYGRMGDDELRKIPDTWNSPEIIVPMPDIRQIEVK